MIDEKFMLIIEQCEQRPQLLTDWERTFIMGDPTKERSTPLRDRSALSIKQKNILLRLETEKLLGETYDKKAQLKHGIINAIHDSTSGYIVHIGDAPVGFGISKKEAVVVTTWLSAALDSIRHLKLDLIAEQVEPTPIQNTANEPVEDDNVPF